MTTQINAAGQHRYAASTRNWGGRLPTHGAAVSKEGGTFCVLASSRLECDGRHLPITEKI